MKNGVMTQTPKSEVLTLGPDDMKLYLELEPVEAVLALCEMWNEQEISDKRADHFTVYGKSEGGWYRPIIYPSTASRSLESLATTAAFSDDLAFEFCQTQISRETAFSVNAEGDTILSVPNRPGLLQDMSAEMLLKLRQRLSLVGRQRSRPAESRQLQTEVGPVGSVCP